MYGAANSTVRLLSLSTALLTEGLPALSRLLCGKTIVRASCSCRHSRTQTEKGMPVLEKACAWRCIGRRLSVTPFATCSSAGPSVKGTLKFTSVFVKAFLCLLHLQQLADSFLAPLTQLPTTELPTKQGYVYVYLRLVVGCYGVIS